MRVMIYNIFEGGQGRVDPLCHVIRSAAPHIAVLCDTRIDENVFAIARKVSMHFFQAKSHAGASGGVALLSRHPISEAVNLGVVDPRFRNAALSASVDAPCGPVQILAAQLHAGDSAGDEPIRIGEVHAILEYYNSSGAGPGLLFGDFSAAHASAPTFRAIAAPTPTAPISPAIPGQRVGASPTPGPNAPVSAIFEILRANWVDAGSAAANRDDAAFTPTDRQPHLRRDHIFIDPAHAHGLAGYGTLVNPLAKFASDHYPIVADFSF